MSGGHAVRGFNNRDIREKLMNTPNFSGMRNDERRQSAKVSRILHRFHVHGLKPKIPREVLQEMKDLSSCFRGSRFFIRIFFLSILESVFFTSKAD